MEEHDIDIIEFKETFHADWLNGYLRKAGVYGGIKQHLIPLKSGGYVLPRQAGEAVDKYIVSLYQKEAGGREIESSQEVYELVYSNGRVLLEADCKAMVIA